MLRIALQLLLALSLVLQGPLPVLAAISAQASADDCARAMAQEDGGKNPAEKSAPCCRHDCTPAACMQVCLASAAFVAPAALTLARFDPASAAPTRRPLPSHSRDEGPPIRPPIA